jgi:hypothetical protein
VSGPPAEEAPDYHLYLDEAEVPVVASALRLMIADEAHEPVIRGLAREVLEELSVPPPPGEPLVVALTPEQMKITHGAVRLLLNDSQREQAHERELLHSVLAKLPDEHTMRAIQIS